MLSSPVRSINNIENKHTQKENMKMLNYVNSCQLNPWIKTHTRARVSPTTTVNNVPSFCGEISLKGNAPRDAKHAVSYATQWLIINEQKVLHGFYAFRIQSSNTAQCNVRAYSIRGLEDSVYYFLSNVMRWRLVSATTLERCALFYAHTKTPRRVVLCFCV